VDSELRLADRHSLLLIDIDFDRAVSIYRVRSQVELLLLSGSLGPNGYDPEIEKRS
jgi:hypothetical protein